MDVRQGKFAYLITANMGILSDASSTPPHSESGGEDEVAGA